MKKLTLLVAVALLVAVPVAAVNAARFEQGEMVSISNTETVTQNFYGAGGQVNFSTSAQKDLLLAGGKIIVNGEVWGDAYGAGGSVDILNDVRGDVRVAGGQVTISGKVGGDVIAAGGSVTLLPGSTVSGDVVVAGGKVTIGGAVSGQTKIYGGDVTLNSLLAGPVTVRAGNMVTFGQNASIGSTLEYSAPTEATVLEGAKLGDEVTFTKSEMPVSNKDIGKILFTLASVFIIIKLLATALTSVVVVSVFKTFSMRVVQTTLARFWHMVLLGLGVLVAGPVLIVLLMVTGVGVYLGLIVGAVYALALLFAGVYLSITTGAYVAKLSTKEVRVSWKWTLVGVAAVFVVSLVPLVGWIPVFVVYLASIGTLVTNQWAELKEKM